jgi:acid phosphatase (class A)
LESAESVTDTETYVLPPSPANSSRETKKELASLHDYQNARTEERVTEIKREMLIDNAFFGEETYASLLGENRRPRTSLLMAYVVEFEFPYIMELKQDFNRVRPSHLDPTLIPAIEVPRHPAYPSGHSTQAHLRAFIFAELDPENRDTYIESADRIARNREIAGVHYPSDSKAGVILATQLFETLMQNTDFATLIENAKTEW